MTAGNAVQLISNQKHLDLTTPHVMGVINVTPDSFFPGSRCENLATIVQRAEQMVAEGATILDIGGESARPGAVAVSIQEELDRVIPVVEKLHQELDASIWLSVDTCKPEVMQVAITNGVDLVNDICALQNEKSLKVIANSQVAVCLMHMQGEPRTMQQHPHYQDVVTEVYDFLKNHVEVCMQAGINKNRIIIDPGFGFGKTIEHNLTLLRELKHFQLLKCPVLVGLSRKSTIGAITGKPTEDRLYGSLAAVTLALERGAHIIRTHDVAPIVDAVKIVGAMMANDARSQTTTA